MFDITVLIGFIIITLIGVARFFINRSDVFAYIELIISILGFLSSLIEVRPNLLKMRVDVKILRVISSILLIGSITLFYPFSSSSQNGPIPTPISLPTATLPPHSTIIEIASEFPTSGSDTTTGQPLENAVKMAIDDANNNDVLHGYTLTLIPWNDVGKESRSDPDKGVENLQEAIKDHLIAGVVGPYYSRVAKVLLPIANEAPIALISPSTIYACLTKNVDADSNCSGSNDIEAQMRPNPNEDQPTFFRLSATDQLEGKAAADYFFKVQHYKKVVLVTDNSDPYSGQLAIEFQQEWNDQLHGQPIASLDVREEGSSIQSYQNALQSETSLQPDLIYFIGSSLNGTYALQALSNIPAFQQVAFAGDGNIVSANFQQKAGEIHPNAPVYATVPIQDPAHSGESAGISFESKYAAYGNDGYRPSAAFAYDATMMLIEAIKIALKGVSTPREKLDSAGGNNFRQAVIKALANLSYTGITGTHSFNANGDTTNPAISFYRLDRSTTPATWKWFDPSTS